MDNAQKAKVLVDALPYIKKYYDKTIVIKYGGNAMTSEHLKEAVMRDVVLLQSVGVKVVLVHGGGPEISETLDKMNMRSAFVNGLRYTDKDTAEVVRMVLAGKVNKSLVSRINSLDGSAIGLCGIDGNMLEVSKKTEDGVDYGYVGEIQKVNAKAIVNCLSDGYIPVIATIAADREGNVYNINADTAAAHIAAELKAENLIMLTDIAGLLKDKDDPATLIPKVYVSDVPYLKKQGIISGGMIPKIDGCVEAVRRGVRQATVIDGRIEHSILIEMLSNEGIGTLFTQE